MAYAVGNWKWDLDHRKCSFCGTEMEVYRIWSKKYGEIYHMLHDLKTRECDIPPPETLRPLENESISQNHFLESCYEQLSFDFVSGQAFAP